MSALADHAFDVVTDDVPAVAGLLQSAAPEAGASLPAVVPLDGAEGEPAAGDRLVFISSDSLAVAAPIVKDAARSHRLGGLVVGIEDPRWFPQALYQSGLRTVRNTLVHEPGDDAVRRRVLAAHLLDAQDALVARVRVRGDVLVVLTCGLDVLEVPFDAHPALRRLPDHERPRVHLSDVGHRLSWLDGQIEVDLDGLRYAVDPDYREAVAMTALFRGAVYGAAVRAVRREHRLRQTDVDGLSARQVRRIEQDGTTSLPALRALAAAHGLDTDAYLDLLAARASEALD